MQRENPYSSQDIDLCGPWRLAWCDEAVQAACVEEAQRAGLSFYDCAVPGNFELDLFRLGRLPDPFFGMNPVEVSRATERCHVYYARRFDAAEVVGASPWLVLEGVDCFAEVYLNGAHIASLDNMLVEHAIPIEASLRPGSNELLLHIRPAYLEAMQYEYPQLVSSLATNYESIYVRKAPHMYGWDIMPRFLSAGLYRPARVEYRPREGIEELYLKTVELSADRKRARLLLHYKVNCAMGGEYSLRVRMRCGDSVAEAYSRLGFIAGKVSLTIDDPALWWPKGRGAANLYDVEVALFKGDAVLDARRFAHGIRTVELKRTALTTSTGEGEFVFLVNGERVFAKGTNWVPVDAFHSRDRQRIPAILDMVNELNCNMVRCWGGNVYEDELFYDICDRSGILVWQDFGMACSVYPQDDAFAKMLADEAAAVVRRLRSHACVALWSGDNECDWSYLWGDSRTDPNTNRLTRRILPEVLRLHDGTRPYLGSSPYFDTGTLEKGADYLPEMHLWGPRDYFKSQFYLTSLCHFVSEIGYHGCPAPESVAKFISADRLWPCTDNEEWLLHCTSPVPEAHAYDYRVELMRKQIAELFTEVPDNLYDFALASQVVQAEAKKFFIELFRMAKWRRTGILWWNVMDGWPQFSDAVVDYYFQRKLAYFFIRNCQQDVCVMLDEPNSWVQKVVAANDTREDKEIHCQITDIASGEVVFEGAFTARADQSTVIGQIPYVRNRQRFFVIRWHGDAQGCNHYLAGQPPFDLAIYRRWLQESGLYNEALRAFLPGK